MMDSFVFYKSFFEGIEALPEDAQAKAYAAICKYALFGEEPQPGGLDYVVFVMARAQIDANNKRREAGRKGGEANGSKGESTAKQTEAKAKQNEATTKQAEANVNVNVNDNVNDNVNNNAHSDKALGEEFDTLWGMYPRKRGDREKARNNYIKGRKSKVLPIAFEDVKKGIEAYKTQIEEEQIDPQFVMYGSTFFNGRRWNDDFTVKPRSPNHFENENDYNWDELEKDLFA